MTRRKQFRPMFLKHEELAKLMGVLKTAVTFEGYKLTPRTARDFAICSLLCYEGLRCNEVRMLDQEDARYMDQELVVRFAKGGKERRIPLFDAVGEAIWLYEQVRPEAKPGHEKALFLSAERTRIATRTIRTDAKRWARMAGLPETFHPHTGRHSSVVRMREAGVRIEAVRDHHGHSSIAITDMYSHLSPEHLRMEVGKAAPV